MAENYQTLQDATAKAPLFASPDVYVFFRRNGRKLVEKEGLTLTEIRRTHSCIGAVSAKDDGTVDEKHLNALFLQFQQWNEDGRGNEILQRGGMQRSALQVGDILWNPTQQKAYICRMLSWKAVSVQE